jgi:hypothetical protein
MNVRIHFRKQSDKVGHRLCVTIFGALKRLGKSSAVSIETKNRVPYTTLVMPYIAPDEEVLFKGVAYGVLNALDIEPIKLKRKKRRRRRKH